MEIPSFALVHVPGESLDRMHLFFGPETLPATSIDSLSQPRTLPQFFLSPWNTSESIFVFDDFKGVLNLGEAFLWIEANFPMSERCNGYGFLPEQFYVLS